MSDIVSGLLVRSDGCQVRSIDVKARSATFVAATETGCEMWDGLEYLLMAGCELERYLTNPVILDAHQRRDTCGSIVGRSKVAIKDRVLIAEIEFASTARAEELWTLVRDGFLRTLSVGYFPTEFRFLADGEVYGDAASQIKGPGVVVTKWELIEISLVPVPADPNALIEKKRAFFMEASMPQPQPARPNGNINFSRALAGQTAAAPPVEGSSPPPAPAELAAPAAPAVATPAAPAAPGQPAAPAATGTSTAHEAEALQARARAVRKENILSFTPPALRSFAEDLVLEDPDIDPEAARKRLLDEHAKRSRPVGTPEPIAPDAEKRAAEKAKSDANVSVADMTPEDFARCFKS